MTTSALMMLGMQILAPFSSRWSLQSITLPFIPARPEPASGSLIAIARTRQPRSRGKPAYSSLKPTFSLTWKCATLPSAI